MSAFLFIFFGKEITSYSYRKKNACFIYWDLHVHSVFTNIFSNPGKRREGPKEISGLELRYRSNVILRSLITHVILIQTHIHLLELCL